ncbi:MAG TPA: AI-2E family transporter [Candidatus Paceibacterota bacterium]|nr:AI-2E family transporter [Candidatus Paceibacterota bacterium]
MAERRVVTISTATIIKSMLLVLAAYVLFLLRNILLLVLVSIVIASFVEAGVIALKRHKVSRMMSVPIIFALTIIIIFGIFYAFVPIVVRELSDMLTLLFKYLPTNTPITQQSIQGATQLVNTITKHSSLVDLLTSIKNATATLSQGATSLIGSTFGGLLNFILVVVMSFYLSIQERGIDTFLRLLTPVHEEKYVLDLWSRTQRKIGLWFKGQLLLGFMVGAIAVIVLALLGVQYSFLIGVVSGVAELIPFGIIFAAVPAILFAIIDGGVLLGIKVLIFYIVLQQIEGYVLSPLVTRHVVGIPPLVVLLAFLVGITLAGFWGALVAMPVAVFILEYMGDIEKRRLITITANPVEQ